MSTLAALASSPAAQWFAAAASIGVIAFDEARFALARRRRPRQVARWLHASLREDWFDAVSRQPGSELLAVQTLRNSLMSASVTASTAVLGLMGGITLSAGSLREALGDGAPAFTPRLAMELILLLLLFSALVSSVMAVRYYNHAGFVAGMPVGSQARERWGALGASHVRRAGVLYSWSLRNLVLVAAPVAFILHPFAGPVAAVLVAGILFAFERTGPDAGG